MARGKKKRVHHVEMTEGKRAVIQGLLQEYDIQSAEDIQDVLKDLHWWHNQRNDGGRNG